MLHASHELFLQLNESLLKAINRIFDTCKEKNIHLRDEDRRDRFALIITGKKGDLESHIKLPERLRIILDPNVSQTDIIIIDNFVFINNINTGFGLSLRINDQNVASTYAILLSHIFIEKQIELYGNRDLGILGIHMSKENILKETLQKLFENGWKTLPDHTNSTEHFDELGLVAPGSVRAFFRLSGIRYYPFTQDESKDQQINTLFKDTINRGLAYIQRLRRQLRIHGKKEELKKIHGHDCYIYWIKYEFKKEWVPLIGNIPKMDSIPDKGEGFVIATFNFNDKAAMSIWAINPQNVLIILEMLLKQF
jgi:hypothetical protein